MREVVGVVLLIAVILSDKDAHRVTGRLIAHLSGCLLASAHCDLLVGGGQIALRRLRLAHRVGALGKLDGVGVAVGVGAQSAHVLACGVQHGELCALKGVAVVAVGDAGVGTGLVDAQLTGDHAPVNLEEARTGLGVTCGADNSNDCLTC